MAALGSKLRTIEGGLIAFRCPGCKDVHHVAIADGPGRGWTFNGNGDAPTFRPSVLVTSGHFSAGWKPGAACWCTYNKDHPDDPASFTCGRCHSFVTDGRIEFLSDSTHELASQTVPLPDFAE